jgi:nitronate monooxygenase
MISLRNGFDGLRRNASFEQPNYAEAREAGDTDVAAVIVGEAVDLVHTEETASYILSRICSDAETLLGGMCRFLG